jgi:hypothetical protein
MFIGSAERSAAEARMHLAADGAAVRARADVGGQQAGLGLDLVEVLADGQRVPDLDAVVLQEGTSMDGDSSRISAFMAGSSGGITFSVKSSPASLAISQPRRAQAP